MSKNRPRLSEVVAIEPTKRKDAQTALTQAYQQLGKADLLQGLTRTYKPNQEDGFQYPSEEKKVQVRARGAIESVKETLANMFDVVFTKDKGNTAATADIVVDGRVLVEAAPVPFILWLEKELVDLRTFVQKLPALDPAQEWAYDENVAAYRSKATSTAKTKKVPRVLVKYEATKEHPAQTEVYHEDVAEGLWTKTEFSGALPQAEINAMLERVARLQEAVKVARERANATEIEAARCGEAILGYLFG